MSSNLMPANPAEEAGESTTPAVAASAAASARPLRAQSTRRELAYSTTEELEPDLAGMHLPPCRRGSRYSRQEWTNIIGSICPRWGSTGRQLMHRATERLLACDQERARMAPVPAALAGTRWTDATARGPRLYTVLAKAEARLRITLTQVIPDEPAYRTRAEAVHGIQSSWVRSRAQWDGLVDGLADPGIYCDPQQACNRLADLEFGPLFLRAILRDDHHIDITRLPGFRVEHLREHRDASELARRIATHEETSEAATNAFYARRIDAARRATGALAAWLAHGGSQHPPRMLQELLSSPVLAGATLHRSSWTAEATLDIPNAGRFIGRGCHGLLREIVTIAAVDPTQWWSSQRPPYVLSDLPDAIRAVAAAWPPN